ncbi:hypothetical protein GCM10022221_16440 [Actinocorallia aurea]
MLMGFDPATAEEETLLRLSQDATVHSVFWTINNGREPRTGLHTNPCGTSAHPMNCALTISHAFLA